MQEWIKVEKYFYPEINFYVTFTSFFNPLKSFNICILKKIDRACQNVAAKEINLSKYYSDVAISKLSSTSYILILHNSLSQYLNKMTIFAYDGDSNAKKFRALIPKIYYH